MTRFEDRLRMVEQVIGLPERFVNRHVLAFLRSRELPPLQGENRIAFLFEVWLAAIGGGARASTEAEVQSAIDQGKAVYFMGEEPTLDEDAVALIRELEGLGPRQPTAEEQGEWA